MKVKHCGTYLSEYAWRTAAMKTLGALNDERGNTTGVPPMAQPCRKERRASRSCSQLPSGCSPCPGRRHSCGTRPQSTWLASRAMAAVSCREPLMARTTSCSWERARVHSARRERISEYSTATRGCRPSSSSCSSTTKSSSSGNWPRARVAAVATDCAKQTTRGAKMRVGIIK